MLISSATQKMLLQKMSMTCNSSPNLNSIFLVLYNNILEEESHNGTANSNTVGICEDDPDLLDLFQQTLYSQYSIIAVDSGIECLRTYIDEKVKGNQIDVLLVDYKLKDLPGDIVATTIRELSGSRPRLTNTILINACEVDEELIEELKKKDYIIEGLEKPISTVSLIKIIERAVV